MSQINSIYQFNRKTACDVITHSFLFALKLLDGNTLSPAEKEVCGQWVAGVRPVEVSVRTVLVQSLSIPQFFYSKHYQEDRLQVCMVTCLGVWFIEQ